MTILVTGSYGLIGSRLLETLSASKVVGCGIDIRAAQKSDRVDVTDLDALKGVVNKCSGIVHLAAVARVAQAQNDPRHCTHTNLIGMRNVIAAALASSSKPWIIFGSSREVYGQQEKLPVHESAGLSPMNIYGYTKAIGEMEMLAARYFGLQTAVVRFSNVYGSTNDHSDRVIPAFIKAAISNNVMKIEGKNNIFDFTHVDEVTRGLLILIKKMQVSNKEVLPPIHFTSGSGITLEKLSHLISSKAGRDRLVLHSEPRTFDVHSFVGNITRAKELLGWENKISLPEGISKLINDFRKADNENTKGNSRISYATQRRF